jgi:hypothetical protein
MAAPPHIILARNLEPRSIAFERHIRTISDSHQIGWLDHMSPVIERRQFTYSIPRKVTLLPPSANSWHVMPETYSEDRCNIVSKTAHLQLARCRVVESCRGFLTLLVTDPASIRALELFDLFQSSILKVSEDQYLLGVAVTGATYWTSERKPCTKEILATENLVLPLLYPGVANGVLQWQLSQLMFRGFSTESLPVLPPFNPVRMYVPFAFPPLPPCAPRPPPLPCIGLATAVAPDTTCPILGDDVPLTPATAYQTQCKHFYDRSALLRWWSTSGKRNCPYCRAIEPVCRCRSCKVCVCTSCAA